MSLRSFVKNHGLTSPKIKDLSFIGGGGHYYTNIHDAVADAGSGTPSNAMSTNNMASCEVFFGNDVTVVRLLSDCEVTSTVNINAPMIIELNNHSVSLSTSSTSNAVFAVNGSCVFYGRDNGQSNISNVSSTRATVMGVNVIFADNSYFAMINCSVYTSGDNNASCCLQYGASYADFVNSRFESCGSAGKIIVHNHRATSAAERTTALYQRCVVRASSTKESYQSGNGWMALNFSNGNITLKDTTVASYAINKLTDDDSANGVLFSNKFGETVAYICNSKIESVSRGASIQCTCYSEHNHFSSAVHGGVYVSNNAVLYDKGSTFERIGNDTTTANGCSYVSYGASAYFDGSAFLCGGALSPLAITSTHGDGGIVYVSNSMIPCLRVDGVYGANAAGSIFIGENVTIQNPSGNTIGGTVTTTNENYRRDFPTMNPSMDDIVASLNYVKSALLDMAEETNSELPLNENTMIETLVSALRS